MGPRSARRADPRGRCRGPRQDHRQRARGGRLSRSHADTPRVRSYEVGPRDDDAALARRARREREGTRHLTNALEISVTTEKPRLRAPRAYRQERDKTKVTINDIARLANVSKKTVSRVIN